MIETMIDRLESIFKSANFETLVIDQFANKKNRFCFDLLVKKDTDIFSVKIFPNIDNLNEDIIKDIKNLSFLLKSKPILIGIKNRYQKLEDNTIYIRENLPFITFNTLDTILKLNVYPEVLARRGGSVMFLDGDLMKTLREKKSISRKEMSEDLGITKRTLCSYENESMRPSQNIASKILELLEDKTLFRKINVLEWNLKFSIDQNEIFNEDELNPFENHLQDIIKDIGLSSYWNKKGQVPFKLSLYSDPTNFSDETDVLPLFSGIPDEKNKINEIYLKCLMMFTQLFQKNGVFIVNDSFKIPETFLKNKIPLIKVKELEKIDDKEEFIEYIQDPRKKH